MHPPSFRLDPKGGRLEIVAAPESAMATDAPDTPGEAVTDSLAPDWVDFRGFFAAHPEPVLAVGADGRVVAANAACETVWGTPAAALAGAPFVSLFAGDDRERAETLLCAGTCAAEPTRLRAARRGADAAEVDVRVVQGRDETFVLATAAEAGRPGADLFRRVLDQSAEMFLYVQEADGKLEYVSAGVAGVLGWTPAELAGRALAELRVEEDATPRHAGPPEGTVSYGTFRHRDGSVRHLELLDWNNCARPTAAR